MLLYKEKRVNIGGSVRSADSVYNLNRRKLSFLRFFFS